MILVIDTSATSLIKLRLEHQNNLLAEDSIEAEYKQAEKLLPGIVRILKVGKADFKQLEQIRVVAIGETFTGLRIGVVTANALGCALGISVRAIDKNGNRLEAREIQEKGFNLVFPKYNKPPNITSKQ